MATFFILFHCFVWFQHPCWMLNAWGSVFLDAYPQLFTHQLRIQHQRGLIANQLPPHSEDHYLQTQREKEAGTRRSSESKLHQQWNTGSFSKKGWYKAVCQCFLISRPSPRLGGAVETTQEDFTIMQAYHLQLVPTQWVKHVRGQWHCDNLCLPCCCPTLLWMHFSKSKIWLPCWVLRRSNILKGIGKAVKLNLYPWNCGVFH